MILRQVDKCRTMHLDSLEERLLNRSTIVTRGFEEVEEVLKDLPTVAVGDLRIILSTAASAKKFRESPNCILSTL